MFSLSKRAIYRLVFIFTFAILAACTTTKVAVAPDAKGLPQSATATLHVNAASTAESIAVIYDANGEVVRRASYWNENLREITVAPGRYEVVLRVDGTWPELATYPRVIVEVEAGQSLEVKSAGA